MATKNTPDPALEPEIATPEQPTPEDPTTELPPDPGTATEPEPEPEQEPEQEPEAPAGFPYEAEVAALLTIVRKGPHKDGSQEGMHQVGTLRLGTKVTVVNEANGYSQIKNGLWVRTAHLTRKPV